ncbi:MAG: putative histidine kinase, hybrid [Polaromonas sp.]|nr:putative histidine kinase, hybrid [Polaromonas sp.]
MEMNTSPLPDDDSRLSDLRLRTLARMTSCVLWYTSANGAATEKNDAWEAFTGQTREQYSQWGWLDAVHPDDLPEVRQRWRDGVASQSPLEMHYRLRRHDGRYRDMATQAAPVFQAGQVVEWVGLCIDHTQNKQAEAALKVSEERFRFLDRLGQATRTLTDASDLMAITARMLGEHLGATRCAYADVEADSNRFTIRSDWSLPGVPSSAGVYALELFGPQATANLRRGQTLIVRDVDRELGEAGGGRMFNAIGVKAIICAGLNKDSRLVAMMAVHQAAPRDWTQNDIDLVQEVVERCWAHIERVRDSAVLREQDRRKDEFIATLAHELRNPLAPMKYAVAMLRKVREPSMAEKAHDVIDRQVSLMSRLIDDLLELSRINRGLIELKHERVRLNDLVLQAAEAAKPAAEAAHHRLEVALDDEALWLQADPARIVQIIGNLLTNAVKYTPNGGHIQVRMRREGDRASVQVVDNGAGIAKSDQLRLFQMFTQLEHTAKRAQGGLGIGLALVKTLVGLHHGTVRVASEGIDQGSTFTVEFPVVQGEARASLASPDPVQGTSGQGMRVLVVEDNEDGLHTLLELLQMLDYRVAGASTGVQALEVARSFAPEVVLLDLGLPDMDGIEVAQALREQAQFKDVRLVALTGWGAQSDRARTAQAGFDAHLTKPVEPHALQAQLSSYWHMRR